MNDDQLLRYSRHILLDDMGEPVQERLLAARALIVGAGGLGSPVALYLASAGIGHLVLADDDTVDATNLQRQILHGTAQIGRAKAQSGRDRMLSINPEITVTALTERLAGDSLAREVAAADVVLDCSDNFATRHAVNRACVANRVPLVSGAAIRFDGQLAVFDARDARSPCYHCLFPEAQDVEEVRCATMGVFAPLTGIIGTLQAAEAIKLAGGFAKAAVGRLILLDARDLSWNTVAVPRDPECAVCRTA
ncbi:MAG: HesA/MoeB/ThiF family protein [Burkholderiaceae bacterium]